jgi:DNA replication and repair protein RecF
MYLKHLALTNFRNYTRLELDLPARIHILQGENAQGKTNLLEAIYYLATTKSPLASSDQHLVNWAVDHEIIPHANVRGVFVREEKERTIEITLVKERKTEDDPTKTVLRKRIHLDGVPRRALDVVGQLNVVLFLPQDIDLVDGPPVGRRRYLDITLCQVDSRYCRSLSQYNRVVTQRNALLRRIRDGQAGIVELDYWDEQASKLGADVLSRRLWAVRELGREGEGIHRSLTGGDAQFLLGYKSSLARQETALKELPLCGEAEGADKCEVQDVLYLEKAFGHAYQSLRSEEVSRGVTLVGPHRDDLCFLVNGVDMTIFGSRGQQRTVALALRFAETAFMYQQSGEMPILLLDDVISELDQNRRRFLLEAISKVQQVIITTTDLDYYSREFLDAALLWCVKTGTVVPLSLS